MTKLSKILITFICIEFVIALIFFVSGNYCINNQCDISNIISSVFIGIGSGLFLGLLMTAEILMSVKVSSKYERLRSIYIKMFGSILFLIVGRIIYGTNQQIIGSIIMGCY